MTSVSSTALPLSGILLVYLLYVSLVVNIIREQRAPHNVSHDNHLKIVFFHDINLLLLRKITHEYSLCKDHTKLLQHYVPPSVVDMHVNECKGNALANFMENITPEEMFNECANSDTSRMTMCILQRLFAYT